ncbi:predicted protein [Uncinocarpus reesii 1704]|uniref:Uncharacterized protein n=1 Tax=Uncinocarpus reesii (strain UAMH 1704) TaxID=336963 RepID=C4K008_UNCRE|nr:uncharacterized protein UREG_07759 [Uncinocarpus reesii 1704]EEP82894.1 predicted protein [Uncinocarpus reesii 1704]
MPGWQLYEQSLNFAFLDLSSFGYQQFERLGRAQPLSDSPHLCSLRSGTGRNPVPDNEPAQTPSRVLPSRKAKGTPSKTKSSRLVEASDHVSLKSHPGLKASVSSLKDVKDDIKPLRAAGAAVASVYPRVVDRVSELEEVDDDEEEESSESNYSCKRSIIASKGGCEREMACAEDRTRTPTVLGPCRVLSAVHKELCEERFQALRRRAVRTPGAHGRGARANESRWALRRAASPKLPVADAGVAEFVFGAVSPMKIRR